MKVLVTGREGQVAQSLARAGIAGAELVFAARPDLDLADFASIERSVATTNPDLVVSAAAYTAVDRAEDEPDLAMRINGEAPGVLARAAAKAGARIIHLSTDYVFDGSGDRPWREGDATGPLSVYGTSKLAGEVAVAAANPAHAIVRTAWVYSPFGANFVKTMLRLAETRDTLGVVADQYGNPTAAADIAAAIGAVVARWREGGGPQGLWHFAGTGEAHWADFARAIFAASAARGGPSASVTDIASAAYPTRAVRPGNSRLDSSRFAADFGHAARPWRDALDEAVAELVRSQIA